MYYVSVALRDPSTALRSAQDDLKGLTIQRFNDWKS